MSASAISREGTLAALHECSPAVSLRGFLGRVNEGRLGVASDALLKQVIVVLQEGNTDERARTNRTRHVLLRLTTVAKDWDDLELQLLDETAQEAARAGRGADSGALAFRVRALRELRHVMKNGAPGWSHALLLDLLDLETAPVTDFRAFLAVTGLSEPSIYDGALRSLIGFLDANAQNLAAIVCPTLREMDVCFDVRRLRSR